MKKIEKLLFDTIEQKNIKEITIRCKDIETYKKLSSKLKRKKSETYGDYDTSIYMWSGTIGRYKKYKIEIRSPHIENPNYIKPTEKRTNWDEWLEWLSKHDWRSALEILTMKDIVKIDYERAIMFFKAHKYDFQECFGHILCNQLFSEKELPVDMYNPGSNKQFYQIYLFLKMIISDEICEIDIEKAKKQFEIQNMEKYEKFIASLKQITGSFKYDGSGFVVPRKEW